jgi:enoyl-CoA hydratase/carnithine racemase
VPDIFPAVSIRRVRPHIDLVTIERPNARNAVNVDVMMAIRQIVSQTEADPDSWVIILTGAGGQAFCAGADLREVAAGRIATLMDPQAGFAAFVYAERRKVWIAAVEGFALGGGFELVLACELAVASENSTFGLPEVRRGLIAAAGGAYRVAKLLPPKIGIELVATGRSISAQRAYEVGLLSSVVTQGTALAAAIRLAEEICANAPAAVQESVAIAKCAGELAETKLRTRSAEALDRVGRTEDFQEGAQAFLKKRSPVWRGR